MLVVVSLGLIKNRLAEKASQIMNIIMITPTKEMREPMEDRVFQRV